MQRKGPVEDPVLQVEIQQLSQATLLRLEGDMRLWGHPELEEKLLEAFRGGLDNDVREIVLNLRGLTSVDTMGIAALVRVLIESTKRNLTLKVILPPGTVGESLRRVRIFEPWPEYREESAALRPSAAGMSGPV